MAATRVILAGVNDEPTPDWNLDGGLDVLEELGIRHIELRAADRVHVDDMDDPMFAHVADRILARGFTVLVHLAKLGQCRLDDDASLAGEEPRLRRAIERSRRLGCTMIRTMGYRRGELADGVAWERTVEQMRRTTTIAAEANMTLVLENSPHPRSASFGSAPDHCARLLDATGSPHLRMNLDPGNFGAGGHDPWQAFELLRTRTASMHIKDIRTPGDTKTYCIAGEGICRYPDMLRELARTGYAGHFTLEPHLLHGESYHVTGRDGYLAAGKRFRELLEEAGFDVA